MHSLSTSFALLAIAVLSVHSAAPVYTIDPSSVPLSIRRNWCQAQIAACPLLCLQNANVTDSSTDTNTCDSDDLTYNCICSNGITPNLNNFSQTIPFFVCQEYGNQCVNNCGIGNTPCQGACRDDNPCGAQNPTRINSTTVSSALSTASAAATDDTTVYTGMGGDTTTTSTSKQSGSEAALNLGRSFAFAIVLTGLFAGFSSFNSGHWELS